MEIQSSTSFMNVKNNLTDDTEPYGTTAYTIFDEL